MHFLVDPQDEQTFEVLQEVFNSITYTLVKHYDFNLGDLEHFFALYERETEFAVDVAFTNDAAFEEFKKFSHKQYYKELFEQE